MKIFSQSVMEVCAYLALTVVAAGSVVYMTKAQNPGGQETKIERSEADALRLRTALNLKPGGPALVEFMDFECPPCRATYPKVEAVLKANPDVTYRAVNFPLPIHPYAFGAAVASQIATANGQHDEVFRDLFTGNVGLDRASLNEYLKKRKLPAIVGDKKSLTFQHLVEDEMTLGQEMKISGTPTLFVLGRDGSLTEIHGFEALAEVVKK